MRTLMLILPGMLGVLLRRKDSSLLMMQLVASNLNRSGRFGEGVRWNFVPGLSVGVLLGGFTVLQGRMGSMRQIVISSLTLPLLR